MRPSRVAKLDTPARRLLRPGAARLAYRSLSPQSYYGASRVESNSKKSKGARGVRFLGRSLPVLVLAGVLAACGGGGGGGGRGPAPAQPCDSQTSRGPGFALGSCAATMTNVFQPIVSTVEVKGVDSYTLTLSSVELPAIADVRDFTSTLKPPNELRNIIGLLQGQAYENPKQGNDLTPPFVAITDFFQASIFTNNEQLPPFQYASFGTWEKFDGTGQPGFNEGYLGIWYAERPVAGVVTNPPPVDSTYVGRVVGLIGDGPGEPKAIGGRFGFSAPITLEVSGTRIISAVLTPVTISSQPAGGTPIPDELKLHPVVFQDSSAPPELTGTVSSTTGGVPGDASITSGDYEARFFGTVADPGRELAGRFRFTTSNGLVGVASFGAIRQP